MPVGTGQLNVRVGNGHPLNVCVGSGHICHALDGGHMNVRVGAGHNCHALDGGHMNVRVAGTGQICVNGCAQIVIEGAPPTGAAASMLIGPGSGPVQTGPRMLTWQNASPLDGHSHPIRLGGFFQGGK
jgi:hypothetical protein